MAASETCICLKQREDERDVVRALKGNVKEQRWTEKGGEQSAES